MANLSRKLTVAGIVLVGSVIVVVGLITAATSGAATDGIVRTATPTSTKVPAATSTPSAATPAAKATVPAATTNQPTVVSGGPAGASTGPGGSALPSAGTGPTTPDNQGSWEMLLALLGVGATAVCIGTWVARRRRA